LPLITKMQNLCESLTYEILSRVPFADRWLLQFVNKQFRNAIRPTLRAHDPRRRRVLDDVLELAIMNGGVATVRFLFDNVGPMALKMAAAKGDLEMVRLVVGRGRAREALMMALTEGHLDVADYLSTRMSVAESLVEEMLFCSAHSRAALEWTLSNVPASYLFKESTIVGTFRTACVSGDAGSVECLCDYFGKDRIANTVFTSSPIVFGGKNVVPVLRYVGSTFGVRDGEELRNILHNSRNADVLDYLLETQGFDKMKALATSDVHAYAFLVRKGLIPRADLVTVAINAKTPGQLDVLVELYPGFDEWIEELGPAGRLRRLLETRDMQASFGRFRKAEARLDFKIKSGLLDKEVFGALTAMGGKCTSGMLWDVLCVSDDVDYAKSVWAAMDEHERATFRLTTKRPVASGGPDLGMLEFVVLELDAVERVREMSIEYSWQRGRFTVSLARFLLERRIKDLSLVLTEAVLCAHLDVVEMVVQHRRCTCVELWKCIERFQSCGCLWRQDLFRAIARAILEKTQPVWRWLARTKLSKYLPKPLQPIEGSKRHLKV
jgi:hypothetical protein